MVILEMGFLKFRVGNIRVLFIVDSIFLFFSQNRSGSGEIHICDVIQ